MKQTPVEFLELMFLRILSFDSEEQRKKYKDAMRQAKEMEKQQQDEFAIGFADWIVNDWVHDERWTKISDIKELLEIYKKEKGL